MPIDLRRCAEAAVRAVLAEVFVRPEPKRPRRARRRRLRPLRLLMRAVRLALMGIGVWTIARTARDPELRREALETLAQRFPVEELLEEIAIEVDAARAAMMGASASNHPAASNPSDATPDPDDTSAEQRRRRPAPRRRGDANGQRGRKPPNRGTRA